MTRSRSERLELRLTPAERADWEAAAQRRRLDLSSYVRSAVRDEIELAANLAAEAADRSAARRRKEAAARLLAEAAADDPLLRAPRWNG